MEGLAFDGYQGQRKALSIRADSLVIDKKKIGFFRFGLISTAKLKKAVIYIYAPEKILSSSPSSSHFDPRVTTVGTHQMVKQIDFKELFSPTILKSITSKRVAALEMEPVIIKIHDHKGVILTIESGYGRISLMDGSSLFKKNVRVSAGAKTLLTNSLSLVPSRCLFRTSDSFVLKTPQRELCGDYLEADLFLDNVFTMNDQGEKRAKPSPSRSWGRF